MLVAAATTLMMLVTACGGAKKPSDPSAPALSGEIKVDGSSTVFPITEAVAEEFIKMNRGVKVPVGVSGSSGGFKKWVAGEIDINNSSRKIKQEEIDVANQKLGGYLEIPVAYDGLSVVVHKDNTWLKCITKDELKKIWDQGSTVKRWKEVNPSWPDEEMKLYGAGTESGTFEYFTEYVNGKARQSRANYTASEDDNVLAQGIAGNKNSLGYFGYSYYQESKGKIRAVAVDGGKGCVEPTDETIANLTYPIARFIYIYATGNALKRPEVKEFITFYLKNASKLVEVVGYTPLPPKMYEESLAKIK